MSGWPDGVEKQVFKTLDSTNAEAIRQAASGANGPLWILTHAQTQSRARRGRAWDMGQGNFAATLLIRPNDGLENAALRSFIAALALRSALIAATGEDAYSLKWPNDVLLKERKLAGILLESGMDISGLYLCIGIGVNLASSPHTQNLEEGAMTPINLNGSITPEAFLPYLASAFQHWETQFQHYGFTPIRTAWLNHATRLGQVITAKMMGRTETGVFETIDDTGAIVLNTPNGTLHLPAAEIFF